MKKGILLFLFVFYLKPGHAQLRFTDFFIEVQKDTLWLGFDGVNSGSDSLVPFTFVIAGSEKGYTTVLFSSADTFHLAGLRRSTVRCAVPVSQCIDPLFLSMYEWQGGRLPLAEYVLYYNNSGDEALPLSVQGDREIPACELLQLNDSTLAIDLNDYPIPNPQMLELLAKGPEQSNEDNVTLWNLPSDDTLILPKIVGMPPDERFGLRIRAGQYDLCDTRQLDDEEIDLLTAAPSEQVPDTSSPAWGELNNIASRKIRKAYRMPFLSGTLLSESRMQNYSFSNSLQPDNYSRLYLTMNVGIPFVPLKITSFLTTENNSSRSLNNLRISYDKQAFQTQKIQREAYMGQIISTKKDELHQRELKLKNELFRKEQELRNMRFSDSSLRLRADSLVSILSKAIDDSLNSLDERIRLQQELALDSSQSLGDSAMPDTSLEQLRQKRDSLLALRSEAMAKADSLKKIYEKTTAAIDKAGKTIEQGRALLETIQKSRSAIAGLENKLRQLNQAQKLLETVKMAEIGRFSASFSDFTVQGTQGNGLLLSVEPGAYRLSAFYGKTALPYIPPTNLQPVEPRFERPAYGLSVQKKTAKNNIWILNYVRFADDKPIPGFEMMRNNVISVQPALTLLKGFTLSGEFATSTRKVFRPGNYTEVKDTFNMRSYGFALSTDLRYDAEKYDFAFGGAIKRVDPGFYTSGNPFLRRNYGEGELSAEKMLYRKRISIKLSYKYSRDNLDKSKQFTTSLQGYGIMVNSRFSKGLNFYLSYMPFETQSAFVPNYLTDPINNRWLYQYHTSTRTAVTLANVSYRFIKKEHVILGSAGVTRSAFTFNEQQTSLTNMNVSIKGNWHRWEYQLVHTDMRSEPGTLDSLSQRNSQASVSLGLRNLKLSCGAEWLAQNSGKAYVGQLLGVESNVKGLGILFMGHIGWYNKGFYEANEGIPFQGRLQLMYGF